MRTRLHSEDGFTIVEVIVAMIVLLIGMLGVLSLLTGALRTTAVNNQRVGATNVARELVETARGLDFDDLTSGLVATRLQARGLGSGSPWTITRRGVSFTVVTTTCTFDDPADGYAPTAPANACNANATGADSNGDDFRRTTFTVSWKDPRGVTKNATQSTLIVNPSGGLGPRITCFTPITQSFAPNVPSLPANCAAANAVASDATTARIVWTTTPALSLHWDVDDGASRGDLTPITNATGGSTFTTAWNIGTSGSGTEVLDGAYVITGQAFDERDIPGEAKRADVLLNRRQPYAPPSLQGGHDTRVNDWVDFRWGLNSERDILGYRVIWAGPDGTPNGNDQQVCPTTASSYLSPTTQSCADFALPAGAGNATTYYVVAVDRAPDGSLRQGDTTRTLSVGTPATAPDPPTGLTVDTSPSGLARLNWTAPASGGVSFYRLYRDDSDGNPATVEYADRLDRTSTAATTTYTDSQSGTVPHKYWVTAVNSAYNESTPVGPITWAGP